jgi:hypothetical protein
MDRGGQQAQSTSRDFPTPLEPSEVVTTTLNVPFGAWDHQMA